MLVISSKSAYGRRRSTKSFEFKPAPADGESKTERVDRLYMSPGGPVIGWLLDEAYKRGETLGAMAGKIGVTYGYINQLRTGIRKTEHLSQDVCEGIARYLGTCTVVVKLLAGRIVLRDFLWPNESEEVAVERAYRNMRDDPKIRQVIPHDLGPLSLEAKKALVLIYGESSTQDPFHTRELPNILFWLQRAATAHDENEFAAFKGHRDTSDRSSIGQ